VLVLDRDAATLCDRRLVAHLAPDEPAENAALVCRLYLDDPNGRWCRPVRPEDLQIDPLARTKSAGETAPHEHEPADEDVHVSDACGNIYRLLPCQGKRSAVQLRWCRLSGESEQSDREQISLRDAIGAVQSYEPIRTLTEHAVTRHGSDPSVAVTRLCSELERLGASPVVLNRGLREAVLAATHRDGTSMSEIALRCGVVKHDRRGKVSGETSWLARRIGVMPEGGETQITPWIHSDVLATIARKGLGVSPREVELQ
jgi:hypothetical protein